MEVKKADLVSGAAQAFWDVLADQERLKNQKEMTRLARQSYSIVVDRVAAGKVSPVEQTRAAVTLASVQLEEERQLRELAAAKDRLSALWGGTADEYGGVEGQFEIPSVVRGAAESCVEQNPDIALADAAVDSQLAALSLEKAARKPDITFSAGFRRLNFENISAWVVGASIPIPVFDRRQGAIAEARIRLDKARSERRAAGWRLRAGLVQARHDHDIALLEFKSLTETALPAAKEALAAIEEGYRLGKFEYLNVLDAQRTYAELQRRYIEAVASGMKAVVRMERFAPCDSGAKPPRPAGEMKEKTNEK
jgi:cobalt-zinc-cadmium efflux system outer membrane protein